VTQGQIAQDKNWPHLH